KLARNKVHDIELPLGEMQVNARAEESLRALIEAGLEAGKGVLLVQPQDGGAMQSFSSRRACPGCGRGFAEPDPRLFAWSSARGWCTGCLGTGLTLADFDVEQSGEEAQWVEAGAEALPCGQCDG